MEIRFGTLDELVVERSNFWKTKRVLVTGHNGFKGTWLCQWLTRMGAEVYGYSLEAEEGGIYSMQPELRREINECIGDICDTCNLKKFIKESNAEVIIHLAAQSLVGRSYVDPLGTWKTNTIGSLNLLHCVKEVAMTGPVIMVTTDKVYENKEWIYNYRETDRLGGKDPYSASKAAAELAISSWKASFSDSDGGEESKIVSARAGNVVGGGDYSKGRIIPDAIRSIERNEVLTLRHPEAVRPWQHVLESLNGYLMLAERLYCNIEIPRDTYNFGPDVSSKRTVKELVEEIGKSSDLAYKTEGNNVEYGESCLLFVDSSKAHEFLGWKQIWGFEETIIRTVDWYKDRMAGASEYELCRRDIEAFSARVNEN